MQRLTHLHGANMHSTRLQARVPCAGSWKSFVLQCIVYSNSIANTPLCLTAHNIVTLSSKGGINSTGAAFARPQHL
jgi:hypothetical protein